MVLKVVLGTLFLVGVALVLIDWRLPPAIKQKLRKQVEEVWYLLLRLSYSDIIRAEIEFVAGKFNNVFGSRIFSLRAVLASCLLSVVLFGAVAAITFNFLRQPLLPLAPFTRYHNLVLFFVDHLAVGGLSPLYEFWLFISIGCALANICSIAFTRLCLRVAQRLPHLGVLSALLAIDLFLALELGGLTLMIAADLDALRFSPSYYLRMLTSPGDIIYFLRQSDFLLGRWFLVSVLTSAFPTLLHATAAGGIILTKLLRRPIYFVLEPPIRWLAESKRGVIAAIGGVVALIAMVIQTILLF